VIWLLVAWRAMVGTADPPVHWRASYVDATGPHAVEAWRVPGQVRRITDGALELAATRAPGEGYRFTIVDRRRGVTLHGDERTRIMQGQLADWESWTHVALPVPLILPTDGPRVAGCTWYGDGVRTICWSARFALPLVIRAGGRDVYTVTAVEPFRGTPPPLAPAGSELGDDDD